MKLPERKKVLKSMIQCYFKIHRNNSSKNFQKISNIPTTLKSILRASEDIPGMITVIRRGPLNPRTLVSYITATSSCR